MKFFKLAKKNKIHVFWGFLACKTWNSNFLRFFKLAKKWNSCFLSFLTSQKIKFMFFECFKLAKNEIHVFWGFLACKKWNSSFFSVFSLQKTKFMCFEFFKTSKNEIRARFVWKQVCNRLIWSTGSFALMTNALKLTQSSERVENFLGKSAGAKSSKCAQIGGLSEKRPSVKLPWAIKLAKMFAKLCA